MAHLAPLAAMAPTAPLAPLAPLAAARTISQDPFARGRRAGRGRGEAGGSEKRAASPSPLEPTRLRPHPARSTSSQASPRARSDAGTGWRDSGAESARRGGVSGARGAENLGGSPSGDVKREMPPLPRRLPPRPASLSGASRETGTGRRAGLMLDAAERARSDERGREAARSEKSPPQALERPERPTPNFMRLGKSETFTRVPHTLRTQGPNQN